MSTDPRLRASRMPDDAYGHCVLPAVDRLEPTRLVGPLNQFDLLRAQKRQLVEERRRERPMRILGRSAAR